jgi:peptidyl-prolyl cis-trans isomerase SurA
MVGIYSESPGRQQQGIMGWFSKGSIIQRFDPALDLPINGITEPIRSPSGFHILKVLGERWQEPEQLGESYDEAHARHILLQIPESANEEERAKIEQRAAAIAEEMQDASDEAFATRAKEVSQGPSASRGGDLGWFRKGAMVPEFEQAVFALKPGQTSDIVKTRFGLHIIRLINKRHVDPNSLQANRDKIIQILTNVEMQEQLPRWIASLRADATLQFIPCPNELFTAVQPAIQPEQPLPTAVPDAELKGALERWRQAWSSRNLPAYFAAYSNHFNPGKHFADLAEWKTDRARLISTKRYIRIGIRNVKITHLEAGHVRIEFDQYYEADNYRDQALKLLLMEKEPGGWKIVREMTAVSGN